MITRLHLEHILFLDIETVPQHAQYDELDATAKSLWELKTQYQRKDEFTAEAFYDRAGIWAEFGKIVCISAGYFILKGDVRQFRVTSLHGEEIKILKDFKLLLESHFNKPQHVLCAHNGKEFDFPYIARRMIIHGIPLPFKLDLFGKKPWEVPHLDTMELWKFGDYKTFTSLKLMAYVLGIPSPKDDIDGSQVRDVYYNDRDVDRIIEYCEKDTITVAQIFLRLRNEPLLNEDEIRSV
ncbi:MULTISPECIES: 3'-5' exonuclease [Altibacter]|uniref:3'-5' exonuclease n=1 Tax=Altibacter TaxID=1535231 RepID=UPI0005515DD6|nr:MULTISPECIES: 3'-5' exonuclease [Altibacter]MCW8980744.1 3'-5' exonuclease [Altibacter sp.]MCW9038505.1 3'-5' exonuclease [Altibacter sp.]